MIFTATLAEIVRLKTNKNEAHDDKVAYRPNGDFDYTVKIFKDRESMAKAIRKQQETLAYPFKGQWTPLIALKNNEGY